MTGGPEAGSAAAGSSEEGSGPGGGHSRAHAAPFFCPYCGEEDLVPLEAHGQWACGSCRRAFRLSMTAIAADLAAGSPGTPDSSGPTPGTSPREAPGTRATARSSAASTTGGEH